ncbi:MAG: hypothetical protein QG611_192 [Bacteroidota bacterium]|nr:hypothetical protein [Bacteroidota bacterium]
MILLKLKEMKKLIITSVLATMLAFGTTASAQNYQDEYLGLPGDNLNLYAVMKLFQESETLEGFERDLNAENSRINNLDLNGDNLIDYISVSDYVDGDVHTIVLRAALNRNESQDVAVFTVQKFRDGSVQIQLIGDADLYGKNYIIEPIYDETPNPGYTGRRNNSRNVTVVRTNYYEVAAWPVVRFIYMPNYSVWHSSWYWGYYPTYWNPWRPYYWHYYYGYHYHWYPEYYRHYHHYHSYRYTRYNDFYYNNMRAHSPNVSSRIKSGNYKETYSRPEQRRDGEELYAKTYPTRERRTSDHVSRNNQTGRSTSKSTQGREAAGTRTTTMQRSTDTGSNERAATQGTQKNTGSAARRSTTTERTKASPTRRQEQSTGTAGRPANPETNKSVTNQRSQQSTGTSGRSSETQAGKSSTSQRTEQRAASSRSSKQSAPAARSSANRSSSRDSKSNSATKDRSDKTKESKTNNSGRR